MSLGEILFGIELIRTLQSLFAPGLSWIFVGISLLGSDTVLVGLSAVIYWCFDKRRGRLVTYILFLGAYLNFFLKVLIPWARPPAELRLAEKNETSYGFPSGHAQDSTTFWTWISLSLRKRVLSVFGAGIVLMVGISRVYLGIHYPAQVIGGWVIGLAVAGLGTLALRYIPSRSRRVEVLPNVLFAIATLVPLVIAATLGASGEVNPGRIGGYLFGFSVGAIAEDRYVDFAVDIGMGQIALRIAIGGTLTGVLALALGPILPDNQVMSSFANSAILGLCIVLMAPVLFNTIESRVLRLPRCSETR